MIRGDFYPTPSGNDKISIMGMAFTAELQSIPVTDPEFTQAYWLGWMRWDNLPLQYHVSRSTFEDGVLTFTDVTKPENVPVGFSIHNDRNIDIYKWAYSGVKFNGTKWVNIDYAYSSNASRYFYLPNNLDINVLSWGRLRLIFLAISEDRTITLDAIISDVPYADFAAGNNMTAVVTQSGAFNGQTFTVTKEDISNHAIFQKEINGTVFDIVLASYTVPYNRDCNFNNNVNEYAAVHPMVKVHTIDDVPYVSGVTNPVQFQFVDDCRWGSGGYKGQGFYSNWSGAVDSLTAFNNSGVYDWCGGFVGSFKVSDLPQGVINLIVPDGATFYVRGIGRNDIFIIGRILTYDEILHCLSLIPRLQESGTNRYEQNNTYWYGHVDLETNEFLGDLVNGSQLNKLVDWQLLNHNIVDNDFTEDKIPEYEPESDDIHKRHTGSTGGLFAGPIAAVSNFVTHWVLDASQVQTFGAHLWTDLLDFDSEGEPTGTQIWRNAKIALGTYFQTGSFDPGSIMELLIGLRYFPINLANSRYATQQSIPAVYFGTGRVGVDVVTNPWKLDQNAVYITGGDLDLSQLSWNKYDDWRDVYNVSASIYIPFCGTYELPWSDIYNGTLHLSYGIDILSGALTAFVECSLGVDRFLVCVGSGMVGFEVPITATSANRLNAAIIGDMGNMMGTLFNPADAVKVATALAGGGGEGSTGGTPVSDIEPTATNAAGSAPIVGPVSLAGRVAEIHTGIASRPGITCPAMPGGRGWGALTGQRIPFITIRKGRYASSTGYGKAEGHPRMETRSISSVSGYTECINPDLSGIPCSKEEKEMIKQILETGFYA